MTPYSRIVRSNAADAAVFTALAVALNDKAGAACKVETVDTKVMEQFAMTCQQLQVIATELSEAHVQESRYAYANPQLESDLESAVNRLSEVDRERSAWMVVWGAAIYGAVVYFWLQFLGRLYPLARTSLCQLVAKVATNQAVMSPLLNGGFFAFVIWTRTVPKLQMGAEKRSQLIAKYRTDLLETCKRSTLYWSFVQTMNFRFCPPRYGVLLVNLAFVFWTTYLSIVGNRTACDDDGCTVA